MEIISAVDVGIRFKMLKRKRVKAQDLVRDQINRFRNPDGDFWALRNVSFSVKQGETLGIIGRNGSGKSTLLRVIARVYPPDEGEVAVKGEVSTLFGLGIGFQPDLSGLDNIYLSSILMGLSKKQIDGIVDEIVDFAELGDFINMPVKTYSSGMNSRLGFAIAVNVDRDIVLIDEILGAGDAQFKKKADKRMAKLIGERTVVLVSHNLPTIKKFAHKVLWLDKGRVMAFGDPKEVIQKYAGDEGQA